MRLPDWDAKLLGSVAEKMGTLTICMSESGDPSDRNKSPYAVITAYGKHNARSPEGVREGDCVRLCSAVVLPLISCLEVSRIIPQDTL